MSADGGATIRVRSPGVVVALALMLTAAVLPGAAQQQGAEADSARAELRSTLRAFYFSLAHRDWEALSAHILPAKVVAHHPVPEDIVAASVARSSCWSAPSTSVDDAAITLRGDWAEVSVRRCGLVMPEADEFRFIHFEGRWWIVFIGLAGDGVAIEVAR